MDISSIQVCNITKDDIVALVNYIYGSYFVLKIPDNLPDKFKDLIKDLKYKEDKIATILLNGGSIIVSDKSVQSEDENYAADGIEAEYNEQDVCMDYKISLKDIEAGLSRCTEGQPLYSLIEFTRGNFEEIDMYDMEIFLQMILFGELIYG
jgi:hypothetical protein